jgi:hypothetical protein
MYRRSIDLVLRSHEASAYDLDIETNVPCFEHHRTPKFSSQSKSVPELALEVVQLLEAQLKLGFGVY